MKASHKVLCGSVSGSLLFAYGGGALAVSRFVAVDTNLVWWGQLLVVLLAGIGCLVWAVRSNPQRSDEDTSDDIVNSASSADGCAADAVHTLAKRMSEAEDSEGLQLCRKLNDCLFVLEYEDAPDDTNKPSA
jgi:hypothetical protein|tara:strand:- start:14756 stop:15151 length:396 start_codon:yes stop_codon:yes gene_type:complete